MAIGLLCASVRADEPGMLDKDRWAALTEVQFAELKAAENTFAKKNYKAARNLYEKFQINNKTSDVVSYCQLMMAECVRLQAKPNDAVSEFQLVRDLAPDSDDAKWAHFRIAQCYDEAGNLNKAMITLQEVWNGYGTHITAFLAANLHVDMLEGQHKWSERLPIWQGIVDRFEKQRLDGRAFGRAADGVAASKLAALDMDGAYKLLLLTRKEPDAQASLVEMSRRVIAALIGGKPTRGKDGKIHQPKPPQYGKGERAAIVQIDPQKHKENQAVAEKLAAAACEKAFSWINENPQRVGHQSLIRSGIDILLLVDKDDDVLAKLAQTRKVYNNDRWTFELAVNVLTGMGRMNDCLAQAVAARKAHNDADWALSMHASLLLANNDLERAIQTWDLMKDKKMALTLTSDALLKVKFDEAIQRRRKILELDPNEATAVYMWLGKAYDGIKEFPKAIEEYRQAANEPANLYAIANSLCKSGKHKDAIDQYGAIGRNWENQTGHALYMAALEYEHIGETQASINILRRVCRAYYKASPRDASAAHVRLAERYKIEETLGGESGKEK